jgi:beta-glucosidase
LLAWLARFAELAVRELGDRVRLWWTINEPTIAPILGYLTGAHPPCVQDRARALVVARNILLAHGAMYQAMRAAARSEVAVGPVLQMPYHEPYDPGSAADREAAADGDALAIGYVLDGLREGILAPPVGNGELVSGLAGSADVIGINYYLRVLHRTGAVGPVRRSSEPEDLVDEMGWEVFPEGLYRSLMRTSSVGCPIYVTENGMATLDDPQRTRHLYAHLEQVWRAIQGGADVRGYFYWSLIDNFEWAEGYARHFGLVACDRATLERRPRPTALVYREILTANAIETD